MSSQIFLKTSQDIELFSGYPEFKQIATNTATTPEEEPAAKQDDDEVVPESRNKRSIVASVLSPCGRYIAYSKKDYVFIMTGKDFEIEYYKLKLSSVYDLKFSPSGNFLSTWQRISSVDTKPQNAKIWYLNPKQKADEELNLVYEYGANSQNGWSLQFSKLDNFIIKQVNKQLRIVKVDLTNKDKEIKFDFEKPYAVLKQEESKQFFGTYLISPSENPTICTFTPEKAGKPAHLTIWPITEGVITKKITTKTFFKADSCQLKWNPMGNAILCVATTDFDSSNQSYYGENTLYLLTFQGVNGTLGGNSIRVSLSKDGPIHDFTWSPTSRQFGVVHGFMPATVTFFDIRGNVVHSLVDQPKNTLSFSPSGRYILIAGFGNLQGSIEILDRHDKFKSITKFTASNTSVCDWSPGGEFILTATLSPRLRVDNSIHVWHVSGKLIYTRPYKELLKASWRPNLINKNGAVEDVHDPVITNVQKDLIIHETAEKALAKQKELAAKNLLKSKDSSSSLNGNGTNSTSNGNSGSSSSGGAYRPPHARKTGRTIPGLTRDSSNGSSSSTNSSGTKTVPGMTRQVPGMAPTNNNKESKSASKNRKRRNNKKEETDGASKTANAPVLNKETSPEERKMRSLLKKLRAIQNLKERQANGDKLEDTQVQKIGTESKVMEELKFLGWSEDDQAKA
ncbi:hypothetical protein TBLA_0A08350 [Henningerozyma blattae CBS 6284]|uniref:Eukaryotic translation initiation factor 2A n=1 Tax=Henningerozyma blattae (strain ATCC 34711 / CBS 6284 / DSM 70876 / NBRC 10599 / NRRL Y-10934 / UCD 77-7) TaxID=1071380 RepID=I2GWX2_HENB6|nr:hypothetical protein TBLA_0A08350 [Tetrapisispora blattae CBS 6284]CCH58624.1 hypothetical protein TBLA_0A08350 [Tetrapisispora blattae CBS 6284]